MVYAPSLSVPAVPSDLGMEGVGLGAGGEPWCARGG